MESLIQKGVDAISIKKIDVYTYEATTKQKGKSLPPENVISKGGKTWTSTTTGKNVQGQTVNHVVVWESSKDDVLPLRARRGKPAEGLAA